MKRFVLLYLSLKPSQQLCCAALGEMDHDWLKNGRDGCCQANQECRLTKTTALFFMRCTKKQKMWPVSFSSPNVSCTDSTLVLRRCNRGPGPAGPWTSVILVSMSAAVAALIDASTVSLSASSARWSPGAAPKNSGLICARQAPGRLAQLLQFAGKSR